MGVFPGFKEWGVQANRGAPPRQYDPTLLLGEAWVSFHDSISNPSQEGGGGIAVMVLLATRL